MKVKWKNNKKRKKLKTTNHIHLYSGKRNLEWKNPKSIKTTRPQQLSFPIKVIINYLRLEQVIQTSLENENVTEKNKPTKPVGQAGHKTQETTENISQEGVYTTSFFENIDSSENEDALINADDLPSNMTDSELEISQLSSRSNSSSNKERASFDLSEFELSQAENDGGRKHASK